MCKERQELQAESTMPLILGQQPWDTYCIPDAALGVPCSARSTQEAAVSLAEFLLAKLMKLGVGWF